MPSVVMMSPTMPVRSVPPVFGVLPVPAGAVAPAAAAGGVAPTAPVAAVGPGGGALETVGFGAVGAATGAHAASSAVALMPRMRSIATRRLIRRSVPGAVRGRLVIVMSYRAR